VLESVDTGEENGLKTIHFQKDLVFLILKIGVVDFLQR